MAALVAASLVTTPHSAVAAPPNVAEVNSTADTSDSLHGDGICDTGGPPVSGNPHCTLRAAIEEANDSGLVDSIWFAIPGADPGLSGGVWTTTPLSSYETISARTTLDATTQPGYAGTPVIRIDGVSGTGGDGLQLGGAASFSIIRGLMITRFDVNGVHIFGSADDVTVADSWIGTDNNNPLMGNVDDGIDIFGDNAIIDGNVINDSGDEGIDVNAPGATIVGNIIGLEPDGVTGSGNSDVGIALFAGNTTIGGDTPAERNVISMNYEGIEVNTSNNTIQGNYIGTDAGGTGDRGNRIGDGVEIKSGTGNVVGGSLPNEGNVIAYNQLKGVDVTGGTDNPVIGNSIHSNGGLGIDLDVDGINPNDLGDLDGPGPNDLLNFPVITDAYASGGTVTVLFDLDVQPGAHRVEFFSNPSGADPSGNGEGEVYETFVDVSAGVGDTASFPGAVGDVITATATEGTGPHLSTSEFSAAITVLSGTFTVNSTDDDPEPAISVGDGVCDTGQLNSALAPECTLRAAIQEANAILVPNVIDFAMPIGEFGHSGGIWTLDPLSGYDDILDTVSIDATTQPGYAGDPIVQLDGSLAAGATAGLVLETVDSLIRGFIVHSFPDEGLEIDASFNTSDDNTLADNWVGIDDTGAPRGNADAGILVTDGASGNTVDGNVVGYSGTSGIVIRIGSDSNTVINNFVGVREDGVTPIPNTLHGIELYDLAVNNWIGGVGSGRNTIRLNPGDGVHLATTAGAGNAVLGNAIDSNGGLGIDLGIDGVTLNDPGDGDGPGPNDFLNFPVITSATESGGTVTVTFDLDVPTGNHRVEFFSNPSGADPSGNGEGEAFESAVVVVAGTGHVHAFPGSTGDILSASATRDFGTGYGSTSEFSATYAVTALNSLPNADVGGPYVIAEGDPATLDASGSSDPDSDPLTYAWDLDNDTFFDDAVGVGPTIPWLTLVSLGLDDDGVYPIAVEVDDGISGTDTDSVMLAITNTAPTLTSTGAATTPSGSVYTLNLGATDPGNDLISGWIINWGDGTIDTVVGNPPTAPHAYANEGYTNAVTAAASDEDGTWHQNRLIVTSSATDELLRYERTTGAFVDAIGGPGDGLSTPTSVVVGPDGAAYIASSATADVRRFDPISGGYIDTFVGAGAGGLTDPRAMGFGPDGNLYVADANDNDILRYDGTTGAFIDTFVTAGSGGLATPRGVVFGPGDDLYVTHTSGDEVLRYDGATGSFVETFVAAGSGGLTDPHGLAFGPDGNLYVSSLATAEVLRYDGADGTFIDDFVAAGAGGLAGPDGLTFGPDGNLYVVDRTSNAVRSYDRTTGAPVSTHVAAGAGGLSAPVGLAFVPEQQVRTLGGAPAAVPDVLDPSIRRSDRRAAGGLGPSYTPGVAGAGLIFGGGAERLLGPSVDVTSSALTMTAWVERGVSAVDQRLVAKTASEGNAIYELLVDGTTNEAVARVHVGGTTREARGGTVGVGAWHQVTATWDGISLILYVDGSSVDTVAAGGSLSTDPDIPLVVGNIASASRGLVGTLDEARVLHRALTADEIATAHRTELDPAATLTVGAQQTGAVGPWTVTGTETHTGAFALEAPTAGAGVTAWATAIGIDEPGVEVDTWWWLSTATGVDVATGVRTGAIPTDQWETALASPAGWDLGRIAGASRTQDAAPAGVPVTGAWVKVTMRSDQNGDSTVLIADTEIIAATNQGAIPGSGSIGLRAGTLPPAESWYVDDVRARRLVTPEPITSLGPLDRE